MTLSLSSQHDVSLSTEVVSNFQTTQEGNLNVALDVALYAFKVFAACFNYKAQIALRLQHSFNSTLFWERFKN